MHAICCYKFFLKTFQKKHRIISFGKRKCKKLKFNGLTVERLFYMGSNPVVHSPTVYGKHYQLKKWIGIYDCIQIKPFYVFTNISSDFSLLNA